ncbi:MAG TPA: zinc ribbon domain-containing protein [Bryobacteraceae bacterium]|nr:zinc ribbon domain-containing protein [Bryobacteraceae bacterium]
MPIYEYRCHSCGKKFEAMQKFSDEPLTVHPECGSGPVDRLISAPALQFKGSGWYVNDYAKGSSSKPGESKTDAKSDTTKSESGSAKTESTSSSTPAPASAPASTASTPSSSK